MSAIKAREKTPERKEQKRKAMATYRAKHKQYYCALASEHRARRALRSVSWSDQNYIKDLFDNAKEAGQLFNIQFEVDHIIPLQNKKVCGLHTEFNLQILTREENRAKSNKFEVQ
jgi:5-methylcytosine-specific restriction endonuclease McrA